MRKMQDASPDGSLVITVPIQMRRVAGRKLVVIPDMNRYGDRPGTPGPRAAERGEMRKGKKGQKQKTSTDRSDPSRDSPLRDQAVRTALAVRWVRLLESGRFSSMAGLARVVGCDPSLMARWVRRADGKG